MKKSLQGGRASLRFQLKNRRWPSSIIALWLALDLLHFQGGRTTLRSPSLLFLYHLSLIFRPLFSPCRDAYFLQSIYSVCALPSGCGWTAAGAKRCSSALLHFRSKPNSCSIINLPAFKFNRVVKIVQPASDHYSGSIFEGFSSLGQRGIIIFGRVLNPGDPGGQQIEPWFVLWLAMHSDELSRSNVHQVRSV